MDTMSTECKLWMLGIGLAMLAGAFIMGCIFGRDDSTICRKSEDRTGKLNPQNGR